MRSRITIALLGLSALVGCMKHSYATGAPGGGAVHTERATFYVAGLIGDNTIDLAQLCPGGVARVQNRLEFKDACLTLCTLTLFAPVTVEVECAGGGAYLLTPDEANTRTAVALLNTPSAQVLP